MNVMVLKNISLNRSLTVYKYRVCEITILLCNSKIFD